MKVVFLGNIGSPITDIIKSSGDDIVVTSQPLGLSFLNAHQPDFIVSSGYPHLVPPEVIEHVDGRIINLHISLLPWNRGADPDFWSLVDNTPKGVTIHYMDATFDTGDIIVQAEVYLDNSDTLSSYREKLHLALTRLFQGNWKSIRSGQCARTPQGEGGSSHNSVDKNDFVHLLTDGVDTLAIDLISC